MDILCMSITCSFLVLSLHSKLLYLLNTFHTTWSVETILPVVVKLATSLFLVFILLRMLCLLTRAAVNGGAKAPLVYVYPRVRFYKRVLPSPRCAICLCEGSNNAVLECGHAFHWNCVRPWLDRTNACPLCLREQSRRKVDVMGRVVL